MKLYKKILYSLGLITIIIFLTSCSKEVIVEKNITNCINKTITLYNTTFVDRDVPVYIEKECTPTDCRDISSEIVLIRQLKECQRQPKFSNSSQCINENYDLRIDINNCQNKINNIAEILG